MTTARKTELDDLERLGRARLAKTQTDYESLVASSQGLRSQIDAILARKAALDAELEPLVEQWQPINAELQRLQNEIGRAARVLGGRSTSEAPRNPEPEPRG